MSKPKFSELDPNACSMIHMMLPQVLIALAKKNGGKLELSVHEIDDTDQDVMDMEINQHDRKITFAVHKKN